jgi:hypothetical protein
MSENYQGDQYPLQPQGNGLGVASLVLGILSIVFGIIPVVGLISWILAPVGLVLGFIALGKPVGRGVTIGGLVTSGIGLAICILWVVGLGALMSTSSYVSY